MKKFLIAVIIIVLVLVIAASVALYNAGGLIKRYQPQMETALGQTLGCDVALGKMSISIWPDFAATFEGTTLTSKDDPKEMLKVGKTVLRVRLAPLLKRKVDVTELVLRQPEIQVILEPSGARIGGLGKPATTESSEAEPLPFALNFESIEINDATLIVVNVADNTTDKITPINLSLAVSLDSDKVTVSNLKGHLPVAGQTVQLAGDEQSFSWQKNSLELGNLTVQAFDGNATASGRLLLKEGQSSSVAFKAQDIAIAPVVTVLFPEDTPQVEGVLKEFTADVKGPLDAKGVDSLRGQGQFLFSDGLIKNVNIAQEIFGNLTSIPGLQSAIDTKLDESERAILQQNHTVVDSMKATYKISNGTITSDDLTLSGELFDLTGEGTVGFDSSVKASAQVRFIETLSASLVKRVSELEALLDDNNRLLVPVKVSGTLADPKIMPDVGSLAGKTIKREAQKALEGLLPGNKENEQGTGEEESKPKEGIRKLLPF